MTINIDWYTDGHYIVAPNAEAARQECIRVFDHDPEIVREWDGDDIDVEDL